MSLPEHPETSRQPGHALGLQPNDVQDSRTEADAAEEPSTGDFSEAPKVDSPQNLASQPWLVGEPPANRLPKEGGLENIATSPDRILQFGRYRVSGKLGSGGFGVVYIGFDSELQREVAIKVAHRSRMTTPDAVNLYLTEGRILAGLDHPGIVPIYDVGSTDDGLCYLVSKFIPGDNLAARIKQGKLRPVEAAGIIASVAESLHHAHKRGLVHRDIKPANILLSTQGQPILVDFGLALREEEFGKGPTSAGTPPYMSPEQVRQEGHLVDARSDVYSLGVVLYELLIGERPFRAADRSALFKLIVTWEPRPPRQLDETIPRDLDRIILKALSKRASDRHSTAADLAEDLRHWLAGEMSGMNSPSSLAPTPSGLAAPLSTERFGVGLVPKGLRAFDREDADFFLQLLPGPRGRDGLPDSIHFWKKGLEQTDPDQTFRVGLLYGTSGCGKTSLVKAGLLPCLARHVLPVYVEASRDDTEARLVRGLRKHWPEMPAGLVLKEALARLRRGEGPGIGCKVALVLDQFEQWLHGWQAEPSAELIQALRQCDGRRLQALILVRDDFWMSATRFMRELEVRLVEHHNSAAVDLFDPRHAHKVLAGFGRAFGVLPEHGPTPEQERFLDRAVAEIAQEGKVIPVRLALFAEMVKCKPWTPATLQEVGGAQGIGVTFLEEMFSAATAPPEHRLHQKAARAVLKALLPEPGNDLKGRMQSYGHLLATSGYASSPPEFDELLRILDTELRLITPTDPEAPEPANFSEPAASPEEKHQKYYQLSHDYLIHAIRLWLSAKQRETHSGRVELRLAERAALWGAIPEKRQLPSWWEWVQILFWARQTPWTDSQRRMMASATRYHTLRGGLAAILLALAVVIGFWIKDRLDDSKRVNHAKELVAQLLVADVDRVPDIIEALDGYRAWADPELARIAGNPKQKSRERLNASLALLPSDDGQVPYLTGRLLTAGPEELLVIRRQLDPWKDSLKEDLWGRLEEENTDPDERLRVACALAAYDPQNERWQKVGKFVADRLVKENSFLLRQWLTVLRPIRHCLLDPLGAIFRGHDRTEREIATGILADFAAGNPSFLAELIKDADARQYCYLIAGLDAYRSEAVMSMKEELTDRLPAEAPGEAKNRLAKRQANAAATLYRLQEFACVWPLLKHSPDPMTRSYLIHDFSLLGMDPKPMADRWSQEQDVSTRRALLLSLGEFGNSPLLVDMRPHLTAQFLRSYRDDPDPGIHGAAAWLLRQWGAAEQLAKIDRELLGTQAKGGRSWYVNGQGVTMVMVDDQGQPAHGSSPGKASRCFAIATNEVSIEQFLRFRPNHYHLAPPKTEADYPVNVVSWFDAAAYCRWLSEKEGIPEDQMCYPPIGDFRNGMKLPENYLSRTGYRLPTEWEWEQACQAGAVTGRFFGESDELLAKYAWYQENSENTLQPTGRLKPNDLGLFEMLGNTMEWCHGIADSPPTLDGRELGIILIDSQRSARGGGFHHRSEGVRPTQRDIFPASTRWHSIGFRVARTHPPGL